MTAADEMHSGRPLLYLVAGGLFLLTLDATIVTTALPAMARSLGESPLRMHTVIVAYVMTMALLIPASGWIADRFGTRRVYIAAIVLFTVGSLCCALSQSIGQLVAARVIQGMGSAFMLPVGRLAVIRVFTGSRLLPAISYVTIPSLVGPLIGPALGGWLVDVAYWQWIFLINVPLGLVGIFFALTSMPGRPLSGLGSFDFKGYALLAAGLGSLTLALDGFASFGFGGGMALLLAIVGAGALYTYRRHALRNQAPLFSPSLFSISTLRIGLCGNFVARLGCSSTPFLLPLFFQVSQGYSPLYAGLLLLPVALAGIAVKSQVTVLVKAFGYRLLLIGNTLLIAITIVSFGYVPQHVVPQILLLTLFGGFNAVQLTAMSTLTLKDLSPPQASSGNSTLSMVQMLATGMGVSCAGGLVLMFTHLLGNHHTATNVAFQATFICMGVITLFSAGIFWRLKDSA